MVENCPSSPGSPVKIDSFLNGRVGRENLCSVAVVRSPRPQEKPTAPALRSVETQMRALDICAPAWEDNENWRKLLDQGNTMAAR
jgi:hypothetical protein